MQQGLSTLNQGNTPHGSRGLTQPAPAASTAEEAAPPAPADPAPSDTAQKQDNPAMNEVLRQLFNR
ncbi:hypothetical protein [Bradyrhizobium genosp. P]|uniref:hypothetical protein n=1 Tax=Bradyrhizobium genosp. P TaxID=83641 RepID=UPI003CF074EE